MTYFEVLSTVFVSVYVSHTLWSFARDCICLKRKSLRISSLENCLEIAVVQRDNLRDILKRTKNKSTKIPNKGGSSKMPKHYKTVSTPKPKKKFKDKVAEVLKPKPKKPKKK